MVNHWRYEALEGIDAGGRPQLKQDVSATIAGAQGAP